MLSSNSMKSHLRKILIVCFLVAYGIIVRRLHLEAMEQNDFLVDLQDAPENRLQIEQKVAERIESEHNDLPVGLRDNSTDNNAPEKRLQIEQNVATTKNFTEFKHHEGGVIVTKVHGPDQISMLIQSICLLHQAYNHKVRYDIIVFATLPIPDELLEDIRATIAPVKLKVFVDNEGLATEIQKLSPIRKELFLKRCNTTKPEEITWDSKCHEEDTAHTSIRYNWQAEFRSWHIWKQPALEPYKYMMWVDTDAFCTQAWKTDPMAIAMQNDLVIYFANYPQGRAKVLQPKVKEFFGNYLCGARKQGNGRMYTSVNGNCDGAQIWTIHGFHHITNLDFFRQDRVMQWQEFMIGDCFLCRKFDDQMAVTIPAVMLAPERSWDMYKSGHEPNIFHNHRIDGRRNKKAGGFRNYWKDHAQTDFPEAFGKCEIVASD